MIHPAMAVTMMDIARDLKVSVVTVSKVLRNQGRISAATRKRVLRRAKQLNYQMNWVARSLVTRRTYTIGLAAPRFHSPLLRRNRPRRGADRAAARVSRDHFVFRGRSRIGTERSRFPLGSASRWAHPRFSSTCSTPESVPGNSEAECTLCSDRPAYRRAAGIVRGRR